MPPPDLDRIRFRPATPARWADVETLFGARGACGGCWCMAWRLAPAAWRAGKGAKNKRALKRLVTGGHAPGVLAYAGRTPVGWCAVAPRADYVHLAFERAGFTVAARRSRSRPVMRRVIPGRARRAG